MQSTRRFIAAPRRMFALLAALLSLAGGAILVIPTPASAQFVPLGSIQITDNMDTNDALSTWRFERSGQGTGGFSGISPNSAPRAAFLSMSEPGFSSVGRTVLLPELFPSTATALVFRNCGARVFINTSKSGRRVNVEIIDPVNWRYVALKEATIDPAGGYTPVEVLWSKGPSTVVFRVSLLGSAGVTSAAWVDDLTIGCAFEELNPVTPPPVPGQ